MTPRPRTESSGSRIQDIHTIEITPSAHHVILWPDARVHTKADQTPGVPKAQYQLDACRKDKLPQTCFPNSTASRLRRSLSR